MRTLRSELLRSHIWIAAMGVVILCIALGGAIYMRSVATKLASVTGPTTEALTAVEAGLYRSLAAMRGWVSIDDPVFKSKRREAWTQEIHPNLEALRGLAQNWPKSADRERLDEIVRITRDLEEWQWWIEEAARAPGANESTRIFQSRARPTADRVFSAITSLINIEEQLPADDERKQLAKSMADFRGFFTKTYAYLGQYLDTESDGDRRSYCEGVELISRLMRELESQKRLMTVDQLDLYNWLVMEFAAFQGLGDRILAIHDVSRTSLAHEWLETNAIPRANRIGELLSTLTVNQKAEMQYDAERAATFSHWSVALTGAAIVTLIAFALVFARRKARRISMPIAGIAQAADQLAAGRLSTDIDVTGASEIERLARSFNRMRASLQNAEQKLRDSEAKARGVLETAADGIILVDAEGIIQTYNLGAERLFGYSAEETIGNHVGMLTPEPDRSLYGSYLAKYLMARASRETGVDREIVGLRKDGSTFPMNLSVGELTLGKTSYFTGIVRDISEIKRAEKELRELNASLEMQTAMANSMAAEASAATHAKSEFLANMSHEIRTPMTAVLGFADVLADSLHDSEHVDAIETIQRNGRMLLDLINDILDLSKIEANRVTIERVQCSPIRVLNDVISLMQVRADAKGIPLALECTTRLPHTVESDPTRIRQILINLVGNAIKFTEVGGVRVLASFDDDGDEQSLRFEVIDTGIGLTEEQIHRLFKPFSQADSSTSRKFGGTGLGLSISHRFAELMGGELKVQSEYGSGSCFSLRIPVREAVFVDSQELQSDIRSTIERGRDIDLEGSLTGCRILLAEDGPDNQRLIAHVLRRARAEVRIVENGEEAIKAVTGSDAAAESFHVLLMDMQMPIMDGYAATTRLRELNYDKPIIALTAHAMAGDRQKCIEAGADDYVTKPIDRNALVSSIKSLRDRSTDHGSEAAPSSAQLTEAGH